MWEQNQPIALISIHAPTRGATRVQSIQISQIGNFNPRSYKRSDGNLLVNFRLFLYFNPRSYKRSDSTRTPHANPNLISIHAPTRGAT